MVAEEKYPFQSPGTAEVFRIQMQRDDEKSEDVRYTPDAGELRRDALVKQLEQARMESEKAHAELHALRAEFGREQERKATASATLSRLQFLAYITARRDVPHDLPEGVGVLDPVFAIVRQVCGLGNPSKGEASEVKGNW